MLTGQECVLRDWWTSDPQTDTAPTSRSTSPHDVWDWNLAELDGVGSSAN